MTKGRREAGANGKKSGTPLLDSNVDFLELRRDWRELANVLFVKGETWKDEREVRLLVDLQYTRPVDTTDENGHGIRVIDVPTEAIEEVYVGFNTPRTEVARMEQVVGVGEGTWKLKYTDSHAYQMQVNSTYILHRRKFVDPHSA